MTWRQSLALRLQAKGIPDPKTIVLMALGQGVTFPEPRKQKPRQRKEKHETGKSIR